MVELIKKIAKERGLTISQIEKELGFGNATIRKWDDNSPSVNKILLVAEYLNISLEYLLTGKESTSSLSFEEEFILDTYRNVTNEGKEFLFSSAKMVRNEYKKDINVSSQKPHN